MGDPRKQRRKYSRPQHPWKAERITEESKICKKYGLKNRKEAWRARSTIARFRQVAKKLLGSSSEEMLKEKKELLNRLDKLGILKNKSLEDVLAINVEDLLERRLQTIVYRKGLANTIRQARQLVTHGNVLVGLNIVNVPRYIVPKGWEDKIRLREEIKVINVERGKEKGEANTKRRKD